MSRIVVVRIVGADCSRAMEQFVRVFKPVNLTLDTNPGSAAPGGVAGTESEITVGHPEFEITVEGHPEARVVDVLRAVGVSVLASREQVGAGIVLPMDMIPVARARMSNIQPAEQMPSFGDIRFDAYGMLGDVEDLLRSDWAAGTGPTHAQAEATRDARSLIARAKEALNRAAD